MGLREMPTLECLDERSKTIIKTLDDLSDKISAQYADLRTYVADRDEKIDERLKSIEKDVQDLKLSRAEDNGKRSVLILIGGFALTAISAIFGAVGNILYQWLTGPNGPIKLG
jgi:hypothetical protein